MFEWVHDAQPMFHAQAVVQFPAPQRWHAAISEPDTKLQSGMNFRWRRVELLRAPRGFQLSPLAENRLSEDRHDDRDPCPSICYDGSWIWIFGRHLPSNIPGASSKQQSWEQFAILHSVTGAIGCADPRTWPAVALQCSPKPSSKRISFFEFELIIPVHSLKP